MAVKDESVEQCAGCGDKSYAHNPFKWKIDHNIPGLAPDVYCDRCFWEFRKTEFAEEALVMTLKLADLNRIFSMDELQRAMAGIAGLAAEAFAEAFVSGPPGMIEERTAEEIARVYGIKRGGAQAA